MPDRDAPSGAHKVRRRPAAILRDALDWRQSAKQAYKELRAGGKGARGTGTRPLGTRPGFADSYVTDLELALEQRLAEQAPSTSRHGKAVESLPVIAGDDEQRPSLRRRPLGGSPSTFHPPTQQQPHHYSTDSSFILMDDAERIRAQKLVKRTPRSKRTASSSVVNEWRTLDPDCSAPRDGYAPSHALYIAMICQGRKEMSPAYPPPTEPERLRFERAVPESSSAVTSAAVATTIAPSTTPGRTPTPTPTSVSNAVSSSGLRTSTRLRNRPAATPLVKAVETAGLTPQQAADAQRAALQSYVDSAFSAAASRLESPGATTTSNPTLATSTSSSQPSASSGHHRNLARIIVPAVGVPVVVIAAILILACCLWKRRKRKSSAVSTPGRATPSGLGPISNPRPLMATAVGPDGTVLSRPNTAFDDSEVLAAGSAGAATMGRARGGDSSDSLGTTPSAIGVAFSEPRTPWGRRSLVDVFAGGVRSATGSPVNSSPGHQRVLSTSSSFAGRQPSLKSSGSVPSELRGVGGYNIFGYQPGQPRPVVAPVGGHYDQFGPASIVPVPESAQRHSSEEGSISGYSGEGEAGGTGASTTGSAESYTARLAPPLGAIGYPHVPQAQQSRTTQRTSDGEQGYWTAEAGLSSTDGGHDPEEAERLSDSSPLEEAVNFGSSTSGGSGGSIGGRSVASIGAHRSSEEGRPGSRVSTPRLGAGHGSIGNRRNDGSGSWWNA
ncbi:hypothetical protein JCM10908_000677 [Rhodotorula pacifica]|uniref:uncharacterized protein n=1 Tax=Rhodotorula pacifica TaxID=1495444 RepID=UPI00316BCA59